MEDQWQEDVLEEGRAGDVMRPDGEIFWIQVWMDERWRTIDEAYTLDEAEERADILDDGAGLKMRLYNATRGTIEWES